MEPKSLHIAMRKAIEQFGIDVLTENRLVNILLDYGAYSDIPAAKTIIQAMITGGYCQKILDLGKQKRSFLSSLFNSDFTVSKPEGDDWHNKLESFAAIISKQNGFQRPLVNYVVECMVYGLDWTVSTPDTPQSPSAITKQQKLHSPQPRKLNSHNSSGINTNKTNTISYKNISDTQFLIMKVFPKNAEIFIDGKQQYVNDGVMAVELSIGSHSYEVKAESHTPETGTVIISNSDKTSLEIILNNAPNIVNLSVSCSDSDAEIIINDTIYGKGKWCGLVKEGVYEIEIRKYRFYSQKQTVDLRGLQQKDVLFTTLEPICGNLKINVQPYGSKIIINGENKGTTPLLVPHIQVGERSLTIQSPEGTEYSTIVEVKENMVTDVNHIIPSLFFDDYSKVRLGDYYYEDGTLSHEIALGKKMVGMVFNLNTSDEEKKNGWTHGQIIALEDAKVLKKDCMSWGIVNNSILKLAVKNPGGIVNGKDTGYLISHLECVENNPDFKPFIIASQYDVQLPTGETSGWYLPCIAQWRTIYENFHSQWQKYWRFLKITGRGGITVYATSSVYDRDNAWKYAMGYAEDYLDHAYQKESLKADWGTVRAVAAF